MTDKQRRSDKPYYGRDKDSPDERDWKFKGVAASPKKLPSKIDLSGKLPRVWSQGYIGSCTSCSATAMVQYLLKKDYPKRVFHPSILATYYWTRLLEGNQRYDSGASMRGVMKAINKYGSAHNKLWPYKTRRWRKAPPRRARLNAKKHRVIEYRRLDQELDELKTCLVMGYPFIFGFWVYESFEGRQMDRTGVMPIPDVAREEFYGGHAVAVVGFEEKKKAFLCRNSWGVKWPNRSMKGHFWMPYDAILDPELSEDFWTSTKISMPRRPRPRRPRRRRRVVIRRRRRWLR